MIAALLLGMVLLRRHWLWLGVAGWFASIVAVHFGSEAGLLPFAPLFDTLGHPTGDAVLKATTRAVQGTLRTGDIVGRFGGEEFVVFLPGADGKQARGAAERCRKAVEAMHVAQAPARNRVETASTQAGGIS